VHKGIENDSQLPEAIVVVFSIFGGQRGPSPCPSVLYRAERENFSPYTIISRAWARTLTTVYFRFRIDFETFFPKSYSRIRERFASFVYSGPNQP